MITTNNNLSSRDIELERLRYLRYNTIIDIILISILIIGCICIMVYFIIIVETGKTIQIS